jgi:hypothetical protein
MKTTAEKSSATTVSATHTAGSPFFAKAGGGDFFAPVSRGAPSSVQTKLTVNKPGDQHEIEADKMAEKVMRMPYDKKKDTGGKTSLLPEEKLQKKENEEETTDPSQRAGKQDVDEKMQFAIRNKTSGGEPINDSTRKFMEPRFGNDFSNVRIHKDAPSAQLNNQLNAKAFTYQNHIFFGAGQYQPESPGGKQLLAHELTHVVQQGASTALDPGLQPKPEPTGKPMIQRNILDKVISGVETAVDIADSIIVNISRAIGRGIVATTNWIRDLASRVGAGIAGTWAWIQNIAMRIGLGVVATWNFIRNLASKIGMGVVIAWGWIQSLAGRIGQGIASAWNWIRGLASHLGIAETAAWQWIERAAARIGANIVSAWRFINNMASTLRMMITAAWSWIQSLASIIRHTIISAWIWIQTLAAIIGRMINIAWIWIQTIALTLGRIITQAWNWILTLAARIGMMIIRAWQWIQQVAARIGRMINQAWQWIASVAHRIGMMIVSAWNWVVQMARLIGRAIVAAWNRIVMIAAAIARRILQAWRWLINLARRVAVAIAQAWDWYLHAPDISIETDYEAPDGSGKSRRRTGVGERVTFTGSKTGEWKASGGSPRTLPLGTTFVWTAPSRAATVSINLKSGKYTRKVVMSVLEPNAITAKKVREIRYRRRRMGAGMELKFHYHPKTVSFGNVDSKEVSGPATNIRGYFLDHGGNYRHDSGDEFFAINRNNVDSATDEASIYNYPSPWIRGGYDWIIPNHFKLRTEAGDGKKFTDVTQAFTIEGNDGTTKVSKGGEEVERTP